MALTTGRCMCGAVRYEVSAEPLFSAVCHCRQCRRQSGSAFSLITGFPADSITLHGTTRVFDDIGESGGHVARHFCPDCGSPIISVLDALPGIVVVKAGTLDDDAAVVPTLEVYCEGALGFLPALTNTVRFARSNLGADA